MNKINATFEAFGEVREYEASPSEIIQIIGGGRPNLVPQHTAETITDNQVIKIIRYTSDSVLQGVHYTAFFKADNTQHTFFSSERIGRMVENAWAKWRKAEIGTAIVGLA